MAIVIGVFWLRRVPHIRSTSPGNHILQYFENVFGDGSPWLSFDDDVREWDELVGRNSYGGLTSFRLGLCEILEVCGKILVLGCCVSEPGNDNLLSGLAEWSASVQSLMSLSRLTL